MISGTNAKDEFSVNRSMEFMFEMMYKYNMNLSTNTKLCDIYEPHQVNNYFESSEIVELYGLTLDGLLSKVSPSLFAIVTYIAHKIDWKNINWFIVSLKSEN